ncbi:BT4734/BF3469 family protein [Bacteroides sp. 224]|uniref:BT4734/BF3469 family protein n=1 Tax=Bacteroides sp. 224 TaxID=2302936 RepID=UPI0013D6336B|nr:BT4734/BF3469 family protein [Bacteroides sp. 224]NDV65373.1 hypothetical protein [Bacteroides sp. 224]
MKITQYRNDEKAKKQTLRTLSMETALTALRTEPKSRPVTTMRNLLCHALPGKEYDYVQKVPCLIFGGVFHKVGSDREMTTYNGLITLEVNNLAHIKEAQELRNLAGTLPQTLLAFVGSSGKSVKILVPFTLPDGTLPQTPEYIRFFHAYAYREAVKWYQPQLNIEIELRKPTPETAVRLSYDPTLYYNPQAVAIRIEQPLHEPENPTFSEVRKQMSDPLERLLPGYERYYIIDNLFETSLWDAMSQINGIDSDRDLQPFFTRLAENCFRSGIPEEDALRYTLCKWDLRNYELLARNSFRTAYGLGKIFGDKPCITSTMTLIARLDEFMQRRYRLRRNTVKGVVEYHERKSFRFDFNPLTKQAINSITMNALSEGIPAWDADIKRYLESDKVLSYNPIEEYLLALPGWDGKDYIRELANRIKCHNPRWADLFYTWFLSMVAHWQQKDRQHANSALPLLVGDQGCGKSTFCLNLLPPELRDYYTDSIDFSNRRDVELALNRFALINMDEFDSISPSYQGFMKHIIQKAVVQTRRPHGSTTEKLRRYATFIATSNNFDLLTDPTGSRRFICIEVDGIIDYQQPVNHKQLYAQAVHALQQDERYWFTHEEEAYITRSNLNFQHTSPEEEYIYAYFRSPVSGESHEELTCAEILERISTRKPNFKCTRTAAIKLGKAMKAKFKSRRAHRGWVYEVVEMG